MFNIDSICVVGLGYIGLPTAAIIASRQKRVIGLDVNTHIVDTINRGRIHIFEPGLEEVVFTAVSDGYLRATTVPEKADVFIIAVPTPFKGAHQPDLKFIKSATEAIAPILCSGNIVILESTSPVGTTEMMAQWLADARPDLSFPTESEGPSDISIAHCPERVLPGHVLRELVSNDRVIGGLTQRCSEHAKEVYRIFVDGNCIITDARTAEMCKLTENSFRDVNIAFANELSIISAKLGINVWDLIKLANLHPRVNILQPGPGVGGHCIAVDPWFIVSAAPEEAKLIHTARLVNDRKPDWVIEQIEQAAASRELSDRARQIVACFGLSFKADIDDLRESPALEICRKLAERGDFDVLAVEPNISNLPDSVSHNVRLVNVRDAIQEADIIVILVDHKEFKHITKNQLKEKLIIDTRGIFS